MDEDLQKFADACTGIAAAFEQGTKAMQSLCDAQISPVTIGCDVSTREPRTVLVEVREGVIIVHHPEQLTQDQLKMLTEQYLEAHRLGKLEACNLIPVPEIHKVMQPHDHRNDALPYLMRNKSKYSVPNNFKGKHVPYRQKHHQRKTGRR
jgi:hypothetical protein